MAAPLQPGDWILGKYKVERVLGVGGMGTVYAATDGHLRRTVAIKLLNELFRNDEGGAGRALGEARAAVKLRSEHVARVLDAGLSDDGAPYIVMEFLEGQDLRQRMQDGAIVAVEDAVGFIVQACEGIAEAHAAGIVHRDLKPDNLFVTHGVDGSPHVKVLDFGIAKITSDNHHTTGGNRGEYGLLGSPPYTAPERLRNVKGIDPRSDIWSLGVVLYEALSGARPFVGENIPELLLRILEDLPPSIRGVRTDVPQAVEAAVLRCLEKDPEARFQSVDQLAEALLPFAASWARTAGQRTLAMAGRGRRDGQDSLASSASSAEMRAQAECAAVSQTQESPPALLRRLRVPVLTAATIALGVGGILVARHPRLMAPAALPASAAASSAADTEGAAAAVVPAEASDIEPAAGPAAAGVAGARPRMRAYRPGRARPVGAKHDVDPLEGRR